MVHNGAHHREEVGSLSGSPPPCPRRRFPEAVPQARGTLLALQRQATCHNLLTIGKGEKRCYTAANIERVSSQLSMWAKLHYYAPWPHMRSHHPTWGTALATHFVFEGHSDEAACMSTAHLLIHHRTRFDNRCCGTPSAAPPPPQCPVQARA